MDESPGSATERQVKYIADLSKQKDLSSDKLNDDQRKFLQDGSQLHQLSKAQASKVIGLLLELNDKPVEPAVVEQPHPLIDDEDYITSGQHRADIHAEEVAESEANPVQGLETKARETAQTKLDDEVDEGYYFIVDPTNNEERFFHVSKGKKGGRWEGYTFLDVRGGDFLYKIKDPAHREAVYREILKDPVTAMNEYGIRLGVCGCCGRTLTARDSRLRGIGPICAQQLMMRDAQATPDQVDMLRQLGIKKD